MRKSDTLPVSNVYDHLEQHNTPGIAEACYEPNFEQFVKLVFPTHV